MDRRQPLHPLAANKQPLVDAAVLGRVARGKLGRSSRGESADSQWLEKEQEKSQLFDSSSSSRVGAGTSIGEQREREEEEGEREEERTPCKRQKSGNFVVDNDDAESDLSVAAQDEQSGDVLVFSDSDAKISGLKLKKSLTAVLLVLRKCRGNLSQLSSSSTDKELFDSNLAECIDDDIPTGPPLTRWDKQILHNHGCWLWNLATKSANGPTVSDADLLALRLLSCDLIAMGSRILPNWDAVQRLALTALAWTEKNNHTMADKCLGRALALVLAGTKLEDLGPDKCHYVISLLLSRSESLWELSKVAEAFDCLHTARQICIAKLPAEHQCKDAKNIAMRAFNIGREYFIHEEYLLAVDWLEFAFESYDTIPIHARERPNHAKTLRLLASLYLALAQQQSVPNSGEHHNKARRCIELAQLEFPSVSGLSLLIKLQLCQHQQHCDDGEEGGETGVQALSASLSALLASHCHPHQPHEREREGEHDDDDAVILATLVHVGTYSGGKYHAMVCGMIDDACGKVAESDAQWAIRLKMAAFSNCRHIEGLFAPKSQSYLDFLLESQTRLDLKCRHEIAQVLWVGLVQKYKAGEYDVCAAALEKTLCLFAGFDDGAKVGIVNAQCLQCMCLLALKTPENTMIALSIARDVKAKNPKSFLCNFMLLRALLSSSAVNAEANQAFADLSKCGDPSKPSGNEGNRLSEIGGVISYLGIITAQAMETGNIALAIAAIREILQQWRRSWSSGKGDAHPLDSKIGSLLHHLLSLQQQQLAGADATAADWQALCEEQDLVVTSAEVIARGCFSQSSGAAEIRWIGWTMWNLADRAPTSLVAGRCYKIAYHWFVLLDIFTASAGASSMPSPSPSSAAASSAKFKLSCLMNACRQSSLAFETLGGSVAAAEALLQDLKKAVILTKTCAQLDDAGKQRLIASLLLMETGLLRSIAFHARSNSSLLSHVPQSDQHLARVMQVCEDARAAAARIVANVLRETLELYSEDAPCLLRCLRYVVLQEKTWTAAEKEWFAATAWNKGVFLHQYEAYDEAEPFLSVALTLSSPSLSSSWAMMKELYSAVLSKCSGAAARKK